MLELDDDVPAFAAGLRARGLERRSATAHELHVDARRRESCTTSFATSPPSWRRRSSRMEITRHRLEELFRDVAAGAAHG